MIVHWIHKVNQVKPRGWLELFKRFEMINKSHLVEIWSCFYINNISTWHFLSFYNFLSWHFLSLESRLVWWILFLVEKKLKKYFWLGKRSLTNSRIQMVGCNFVIFYVLRNYWIYCGFGIKCHAFVLSPWNTEILYLIGMLSMISSSK